MASELRRIGADLRDIVGETELVSVVSFPGKLELALDLECGFCGYEHVGVDERGGLFDVSYFSIFSEAFKTFLDEKNSRRIGESRVLSDLREGVKQIKESGGVEVYDKRVPSFYSQLVSLSEEGCSSREARDAVLFFADVFVEKERAYRDEAS